ncbi:MAG: HAMP domain-containing protein, partial [Pirellulales bacterium]|nr:HAMP domain-containing protein [Pirellulales bacterium]
MLTTRFRSLRVRLLLPLLSVALVVAVAVAVVSYWLGDRRAGQRVAQRKEEIARTLAGASFPLNQQVLELLADLTHTHLITLDRRGRAVESSLALDQDDINGLAGAALNEDSGAESLVTISGRTYRLTIFMRSGAALANDRADRVAVLFDEEELRAFRLRAAALPLATGLSTVFLLASVTLGLAGRLVRRLRRLQQQVDRIAQGNFDAEIEISIDDELGRLGAAVKNMSGQLARMWETLHRQEGQKLLHQIAGGLAHQLRNSITGARMA